MAQTGTRNAGMGCTPSRRNFDDLMTRGSTGDASVLPAIMQLLSTGGEDCPSVAGQCEGAEGISGAQWKAFFEASSVSKFMRLQPFPPDGDPRELWSLCCANRTISVTEHAERLWPRCRAGAAALVMAVLPQLELRLGQESAMEGLEVAGRMAEQLEAEADCKWLYQTNRAAWSHFTWFLSEAKPGGPMPCGPGSPKIFVAEPAEFKSLWANPLSCAERGLCFTEVWVHEFLRRAECRVSQVSEADFVYVPIYMSCNNLHEALESNSQERVALEAFMSRLTLEEGPPLLIVFSCEKWKMHWKNWLSSTPRGYVAATVEARPLESDSFVTWHCADCFRFGLDLVIPSAVASAEARRLQGFNRQPADRTLLLTWRGEHAESSARSDVRQGYLEVNETVRPRILKTFQSKEDADVGRSSMRYSFLMGNAHFCLVPRGRGWWTVRLFESFYAGCIPVLLSDDVELPFQEFLSWETFSVKWPMDRVDLGLYEHLQHLQQDEVKLERLHRMVREVACWFDYLQPMEASCSPYQGFLKLLALSTSRQVRDPPVLRRFWF
ncbi:unnamed protein product [Durusdinium trenchii]|uniref:Exostosin GT47 domain-containing protein n=1 Tax=Durusdinium trenchii TaxID=1381693 RepID=A0ABP0R4N1_9DINO